MSNAIEIGRGFSTGNSTVVLARRLSRFSGDRRVSGTLGFPGEVTFRLSSIARADKSFGKKQEDTIN